MMAGDARGLVVVGGGGHAKVLLAVLRKLSRDVIGYTDAHDKGAILGAPYLGDDSVLADLVNRRPGAVIALGVGKVDASPARLSLLETALALGYAAPAIVSPHAVVNEQVALGDGTVVFDGAVVNSGTQTGRACIVNTNSTVEHDCRLGDNVHVASGATVCGGVSIGRHSLIGAGATIIQGVTVSAGCLVGAGAIVVHDLPSPGVYLGAPAARLP
jgi:sugar O-acyltransferase (sialic acid O-acetyltransferase NeuD family)